MEVQKFAYQGRILIVTAGINKDFEVILELANARSTLVVMRISKLQKSKKSNEIQIFSSNITYMSSGQLTEDERWQQVLINKQNAVSIWLPVKSYPIPTCTKSIHIQVNWYPEPTRTKSTRTQINPNRIGIGSYWAGQTAHFLPLWATHRLGPPTFSHMKT